MLCCTSHVQMGVQDIFNLKKDELKFPHLNTIIFLRLTWFLEIRKFAWPEFDWFKCVSRKKRGSGKNHQQNKLSSPHKLRAEKISSLVTSLVIYIAWELVRAPILSLIITDIVMVFSSGLGNCGLKFKYLNSSTWVFTFYSCMWINCVRSLKRKSWLWLYSLKQSSVWRMSKAPFLLQLLG